MTVSGWPFPITIDGDLTRGVPAELEIDFAKPLGEDNFGRLRYIVEAFTALGEAGGLAGDRVAPTRSTVLVTKSTASAGVTRASWRFGTMAIDPRGLAVLFNALAFLVEDIVGVSVLGQQPGQAPSFSTDDLIPAWDPLNFSIDDDRTSSSVELNIEFSRPLTSVDSELVRESLQAWLDCGSIRGYADPTSDPDGSILAPTEAPAFQISGDTVSAVLDDSGVHESCYEILFNVLQKVHGAAPIVEVEIG